MSKDSLTAAVTGIPGEYGSEAEAIQAAKRYIDAEEAHRQDEGKGKGGPPHGEYRRARGDEGLPMKATFCPSWELSTDAAASHEGQPVLVHRPMGEAYDHGDVLYAHPTFRPLPAVRVVARLVRAANLDAEGQALVDRFTRSLPAA